MQGRLIQGLELNYVSRDTSQRSSPSGSGGWVSNVSFGGIQLNRLHMGTFSRNRVGVPLVCISGGPRASSQTRGRSHVASRHRRPGTPAQRKQGAPDPSPPVTVPPANRQEEDGGLQLPRGLTAAGPTGEQGSAALRVSLLSLPASQLPLVDGRCVRVKAPVAHCSWHQITVTLVNHQGSP